MFFHMAGGAQAKMSTWLSKPNQDCFSATKAVQARRHFTRCGRRKYHLTWSASIRKRRWIDNNEFKRIIKLPDGVDPTTVKSRVIKTLNKGSVLVLEGDRRVEEKAKQDDGKFVVKLDLRGFKPEDIKVQLRGHELTVTGKHKSEDRSFYVSRDYSHRVLLPDDADLSSVTSRLSKEGLLIIEASRDPALLPKERNLDVSVELDEQSPEDEAKQEESGDTEEENQTE